MIINEVESLSSDQRFITLRARKPGGAGRFKMTLVELPVRVEYLILINLPYF